MTGIQANSRAKPSSGLVEHATFTDRALGFVALVYVGSLTADAVSLFPGRSPSSLLGLLVIALWGIAAASNRVTFRSGTGGGLLVGAGVAFAFWVCFGLLWTVDLGESMPRVFTYFGLVMTLPALAYAFRRGTSAPILAFIAGAIILSVLLFADLFSGGSAVLAASNHRSRAFSANPNNAAFMVVVGAALSLRQMQLHTGKARVGYAVCVLVCVMGAMAAGSRTGIVALVATAVFVLIRPPTGEGAGKLRSVGGAVASFLLVALVVKQFTTVLPERLWSTATAIENQDLTIRQDIWRSVLENYDQWMPWGTGIATSQELVSSIYGRSLVVHNTLLELGVDAGIVGMLLCVLFYVGIFRANRLSEYRSVVMAAMVPTLIFSLTLSMFHAKALWFLAALALVRSGRRGP